MNANVIILISYTRFFCCLLFFSNMMAWEWEGGITCLGPFFFKDIYAEFTQTYTVVCNRQALKVCDVLRFREMKSATFFCFS